MRRAFHAPTGQHRFVDLVLSGSRWMAVGLALSLAGVPVARAGDVEDANGRLIDLQEKVRVMSTSERLFKVERLGRMRTSE